MHSNHALLLAALGVSTVAAHPSGHGAHHLVHGALDKRGNFFKTVHQTEIVTVTDTVLVPPPSDEATAQSDQKPAEQTSRVDHLSLSATSTSPNESADKHADHDETSKEHETDHEDTLIQLPAEQTARVDHLSLSATSATPIDSADKHADHDETSKEHETDHEDTLIQHPAEQAARVDYLSLSATSTTPNDSADKHAVHEEANKQHDKSPADPEGALTDYQEVCTKTYKAKRATLLDFAYTGNIGSGEQYGCNLKFVSCSLYDKYANGAKLVNKGSDSMVVVVSNKMGPSGEVAFGQFSANVDHLIHFVMAPGQEACIGIADDSQGQIIWSPGTDISHFPTSKNGQYQGVMMEFDVHNEKNQAWSGADCSCLVAADTGNLAIPGCKVALEGGKTCSEIFAGTEGKGAKAYTAGKNDVDGEGCNWNDKTIKMSVTLS